MPRDRHFESDTVRVEAKFGGMDITDVRRIEDLEQENGRLKKLVINLMLDNEILRDVNSRKW